MPISPFILIPFVDRIDEAGIDTGRKLLAEFSGGDMMAACGKLSCVLGRIYTSQDRLEQLQ